jgi:hypothetical protein
MSRFEREIEIVAASGLFDREWYLAEYPDVKAVGLDPIEHYLRVGALLLRQPSPKFDTKKPASPSQETPASRNSSLDQDISLTKTNLLFDADWYRTEYQDVLCTNDRGTSPLRILHLAQARSRRRWTQRDR